MMKRVYCAWSCLLICVCIESGFLQDAQAQDTEVKSTVQTESAVRLKSTTVQAYKVKLKSNEVLSGAARISAGTLAINSLVSEPQMIDKVRITWNSIADAVMYQLVITKGKSPLKNHILTTKDEIYTNGYELDTAVFNVAGDDLYWQVRAMDVNGIPISQFTELQPLVMQEINPTAPKVTTQFDKMAYTPLYPVYSWIPYLKASEYEIQVFFDDDDNPKTPDQLLETDLVTDPKKYDYYDDTAYAKPGTYWWRVRAENAASQPISDWSEASYFTVTNTNIKVAALGDSITHGGGAVSNPPGYIMYDWETYAGLPILNLGFSGNTVESMLARFDADVLPFKPHFLVIMGGVNNIREGDSSDQVIQALSQIRDKCLVNKITPVFVTVTPINPRLMASVAGLNPTAGWEYQQLQINDWVRQQSAYVDVTPRLTDWRGWLSESLTTDGLHPDMEGKKIIGQTIGDYLKNTFQLT
jgi:lysophospholipase L1-like esterase